GYHYYNGSAWVDASGSTNHGALASDTERDAIVSPATNDHAIVAGDFHYFDGTDWVDSGAAADYGSVDTIAQRDALPTLKRNDYVSIGGNYHYVDDDLEWVNTFSSTKQVVPPNPELSPDSITSSWSEVTKLPTVATTADLDRIDWGNYPDGVYVEDTGQVAYRDTNVPKVYQDLCGTSATAWLSRGWLNSAATAGQAMRVQIEVTADTYCRIGFQPGTDSSDSLMVEVQPTAIRGYDDFSAVGSPITVEVGDVIGIFRLTNGQTTINVNSVDVYTFARSDTSAMNIYAYLFGIDDCARYVQHGVDGLFLDPVVWTGYSDATMTESGRTEDYGWSYDDPDVTAGTTDNRMRVVFRSAGQKPELGGWSNIYPDGATVPVGLLVNNDLFTLLVAPGESVVVDGNTIAIDAGYSNLEPVHFAKINSAIVRIGGN
ncbi:MAG: hypothetical protein HKN43_00840, partial [Rhodothermales bacterium]|nr:hypothetical protein [Rhodothermales bacterium]